jgi:hypothetical protein
MLSLSVAQAATADQAAAKARPMSAGELADLYGGKTWLWAEGAGYFAPDRRFVAWSGSGAAASYATGRWTVTDSGRMCFKAVWHSKTSRDRSRTCFSHRRSDGAIYQRKGPSGPWYIFKSSKKQPTDEYSKFQRGDKATSGVHDVKSALRTR